MYHQILMTSVTLFFVPSNFGFEYIKVPQIVGPIFYVTCNMA